MLYTASIASGSNGNCYYVGNDSEAVLVDAGISCKETERRMKRMGLDMGLVRAIFISHEHADHIRGLVGLARKYELPVYITEATLRNSRLPLDEHLVRPFGAHVVIAIGGLKVLAFPKLHDAVDAHSFTVSGCGATVGVLTDIGRPCAHVIRYFKTCHAAYLEANYDEMMLEHGRYPYHLKARIRGERGHLSNRQALDLFLAHRPAFMSHVFLSHLSKDNNSPELAHALFAQHANGVEVVLAGRYEETKVYTVQGRSGEQHANGERNSNHILTTATGVRSRIIRKQVKEQKHATQISLF